MDEIQKAVQKDGSLKLSTETIEFVSWHVGEDEIILDGHFTIEQLEFIVAHIKTKIGAADE